MGYALFSWFILNPVRCFFEIIRLLSREGGGLVSRKTAGISPISFYHRCTPTLKY